MGKTTNNSRDKSKPGLLETVVVYELVERPDGTIGIGSSRELPVDEAIYLIKEEKATSCIRPIGVVPDEWQKPVSAKASPAPIVHEDLGDEE